jgi:hypothetical protein
VVLDQPQHLEITMGHAQRSYDDWKTTLPVVADDSQAEAQWLEESADQLVRGVDIKWKRRLWPQRVVRADDFVAAVHDHLNQRQIDGLDERDGFGRLVLAAVSGSLSEIKTQAEYLLGSSTHSHGKLYELAEGLLRPFAADGLAAQREEQAEDTDGDL